MDVWVPTLISVFVVSIVSLAGVLTLAFKEQVLNKFLMLLVSFAAGGLLANSFFDLLPEAIEKSGSLTFDISLYVLSGILAFFILEKVILWRHCHHLEQGEECQIHGPQSFAMTSIVGDATHNFLDGMIIGGTYAVNFSLGLTTTLAIVFHEIPQEVGDFGILVAGGYSKTRALFYNFLTALTAFAGAILAISISAKIISFTAFLVPFTAGGFIYIAASDLIPELHKQTVKFNRVVAEVFFFLLGVSIILFLSYFE